jgi:purine nucleosidase
MRTFWIDTDTASDDAVAIIMALRHPQVTVAGISVVAGNVAVEKATKNALYVAELCGSAVPVFMGADRPLVREAAHAEWFHGADGLGNMNYPSAKRGAEKEHGVDALIEGAKRWPGMTLVTLGPLTNVALAARKDPGFAGRVGRVVIMGGAACTEGNVTPAAEYNVWCDPEAAEMVLGAGWKTPPEVVGWELSRFEAGFFQKDMDEMAAVGTERARFALDSNRVAVAAYEKQTGDRAMSLPDPVAMAVALEPEVCTKRSTHAARVESGSALTRGMTVIDRLNIGGDPRNAETWRGAGKVTVCWGIDVGRFKRMVIDAMR